MADFNIRADEVDVEQIMRQIRARIREKRGVDYTEEQIQELAKVRLEKFLDPKGVRSDLLEQFQQTAELDAPVTYEFDDKTLTRSGNPLVAFIRRLLQPVLKLFFSPNPLVQALHAQTQINRYLLDRAARDVLFYEVIHNLVVEMTRTGIEVKNMQMRVESIASRLDFNERRSRALEAVVQYKPDAAGDRHRPDPGDRHRPDPGDRRRPDAAGERRQAAAAGPAPGARPEPSEAPSGVDPLTGGESLRSRRRRRRRGRRNFGDERSTNDTGRAPGDELERRAASDEPQEQRATNDEPGHRATSGEPEHGATSGEPSVRPEPGPSVRPEPVEGRTPPSEPEPDQS